MFAPARLGLGLAALGRPGYINLGHHEDLHGARHPEGLQARTLEVLDAAYSAGIRDFDAARSYGHAEAFLHAWLQQRAPQDVHISSKWGYTYVADWQVTAEQHEVKDHSVNTFERQWPETRAQLGRWLRTYLIHSVTPDSPALHDPALQIRLARLREEGVTPGLSLSGPHQGDALARALDIHIEGQPLFGAVQATWNLLEPSAGPQLQAARDQGWHVMIKEALANGRLGPRGYGPHRAALQALADRHDATLDAVALAAALAQPFADVVLSGAATTEHVVSNARALHVNLSPADLQELLSLAETPAAYWAARAHLPWN
ncbi:aldo/keto reductase [Deinococcus maricopensis]|uniref:NADP-dependent oxidoreductase domain protein n=1 Tax=Deinococcus maricopensis (strain DSM 21211 / LMG 22137 / NRRL B-23946 / LB-34) TaxID=709986 RepID=E8U4R7_DEIML|nr:aldo/keto reductase [Deinococcus maricopensis]ADV66056.1 NADP-dependent oxidoreductase domain protein [Deinococcus maricopensis DSM 21211]